MNMIRTFHSVGQGAFYSEDFENFKIVYDCGSYKNKSLIEDEITTSFDESETIDALFISHLHEDHINGVPYLLKRNKVKYIFLPFLTSAEKLLLLTYNTLQNQSSPFTEQLIINPLQLSEEYEVKFVFVMPNEGEDTTADDSVINITDNINFPGSLKSGTKIKIGKMDWLFIPFHFQRKKKTALFQKLITENNLKLNTPDDFSAILKDKKQFSLLENCYREIPGSLNSNSLVLYSGPEKGDRFHTRDFPQNRWFHPIYHHIGSGCIYFGDYDAHGKLKWKELENKLIKYWDNLSCVQIPHHGSSYNYNPEINNQRPILSIISCGDENHYRHPHGSVIKNILKSDGYPVIVTEKAHTRFSQTVHGL